MATTPKDIIKARFATHGLTITTEQANRIYETQKQFMEAQVEGDLVQFIIYLTLREQQGMEPTIPVIKG